MPAYLIAHICAELVACWSRRFAEVSDFWYAALWLVFTISRMRCATAKKYMIPTFVVWLIAIITGALIHTYFKCSVNNENKP